MSEPGTDRRLGRSDGMIEAAAWFAACHGDTLKELANA